MEHNFDVHFGSREIWGSRIPFGLNDVDRRQHVLILGQSGTGKSTLARNILAQDITAGRGCAVIDPHGDLAAELLDCVPPNRRDDVVLLDVSDTDWPVGFNPFYRVSIDERPLVARNFVASLKHIWADSWGPRLEYILFNTIAAILDAPDELRPSITSIPLVLVHTDYRHKVLRSVTDPRVRSFFIDEFDTWGERQLTESLGPVQNKIGQLLANPFLRNILGQWKPAIDPARIIANQQIFIVNLAKGQIGEADANLLGSLLFSAFQQAAMRRSALPERERTTFHFLIDEFHNLTTDAFASALSELRKYGLAIYAAAQYLDQVSDDVRAALFGNVGSIIAFRVSADDADHLAHEIGDFPVDTFRDLARGEVCARLLRDGQPTQAFLGSTSLPPPPSFNRTAQIVRYCHQRYAKPRAVVENNIARSLKNAMQPKELGPAPALISTPTPARLGLALMP